MNDRSIVRIDTPDEPGNPTECPWIEFENDNADAWDDELESCRELKPGESKTIGGGAGVAFTITRVDSRRHFDSPGDAYAAHRDDIDS